MSAAKLYCQDVANDIPDDAKDDNVRACPVDSQDWSYPVSVFTQ